MFSVKISLLLIYCLKSTYAEVTVCGAQCATKCTEGSSYSWCGVWSNSKYSKWDYCSSPGMTISGEKCVNMNKCQKYGGTSYYWCKTRDSWDYCSPSEASGLSTNCTGGSGWKIFWALCGIVVAIVLIVVFVPWVRRCICPNGVLQCL